MIVGFTGTRRGLSSAQYDELVGFANAQSIEQFHHGDCVGADAEAHDIFNYATPWIVVHPPIDDKHRAYRHGDVKVSPKPYIERNHDIVDECDVLIACPGSMEEEQRSGTWATIRYAAKIGRRTLIVWPNGTVEER